MQINRIRSASRQGREGKGREGIKLMGQKFFDMHESSRLNMSFKCSGAFNIIYIMRTIIVTAIF
ncbi:hypothetical protein A7S87_01080 [Salmonella enterica subsp. enterica serovar Rubislaw]|nr:hypothetical protein A7S59_01080 [Salmonella enterica]OHK95721.1 hypothetical protein A7S86_01080 [Salmonella enterica subsp. enterica serovar Rubislaw]OHL00870.1 hypothetical protein A7S87_01080 [Salmonella enterica subsp. enterica serovar Rubislaw]OHL06230.1 hypothetical protein A7S88_01080 [Salmonella enterica subsp. enterica serovar Rubislaw]OHL63632.1 hypothetical protein A7T03_01085 [Salmonella enterica subsp. enterica serovar Rubislaw]